MRAARHFGTSRAAEEALSGLAFLSPNLIGFSVFFAFPLLFSLWVSFFDWKTTNTGKEFIGLDNYVRALSLDISSASGAGAGNEVLKPGYQVLMHLDWFGNNWVLGARDVEFWLSLKNITVFLLLAVPLSVLPALLLSSILASRLPGMKVFRTIYFIPSVAGVIGVSIVWGQMFDSTIGWINYLLDLVGLSEPGQGHGWLSQRGTALLAMVIVFAWMSFGFNTVLYLAGHQSIPKELYEAAEIDGAEHVAGVQADHGPTAAEHDVLRADHDLDPCAATVRRGVDPVAPGARRPEQRDHHARACALRGGVHQQQPGVRVGARVDPVPRHLRVHVLPVPPTT